MCSTISTALRTHICGRRWNELPCVPGYVLDGMLEIGFADTEQQARFKNASPILFADEQNLFEETLAYDLPNGSIMLR